MTVALDGRIADAVARYRRGARSEALSVLLDAWCDSRAAVLGIAVERLSEELVHGALSVARGDDQRWSKIAERQRPEELDLILPTLFDGAVGLKRTLIAAWPADPRIARALLEALDRPRFLDGRERKIVQTLLARHADERTSGVKLERRPIAIAAKSRALLDGLGLTQDRRAIRAELFAQVYADPGDDELRAIVADRLQEIGDARGELIALQLEESRARLTAARARRLASLLAAQQPLIEAELPGGREIGVEKGFPASAVFGTTPSWSAAMTTLTGVGLEDSVKDVAWVCDLPLLRQLEASYRQVRRIVAVGPLANVESLIVCDVSTTEVTKLFDRSGFPRLRELTLRWYQGDASLFTKAAAAEIDLRLPVGEQGLRDVFGAIVSAPRTQATFALSFIHYVATLACDKRGWRLTLDADGVTGSVRDIGRVLAAFPPKSLVAAKVPRSDSPEIRAAVERVTR